MEYQESNPGHAVYKTVVLPLNYIPVIAIRHVSSSMLDCVWDAVFPAASLGARHSLCMPSWRNNGACRPWVITLAKRSGSGFDRIMHTPEIASAFQPPGAPFGGCTPVSFKDACYLRKEDKMNRTKHLCVTFVTLLL